MSNVGNTFCINSFYCNKKLKNRLRAYFICVKEKTAIRQEKRFSGTSGGKETEQCKIKVHEKKKSKLYAHHLVVDLISTPIKSI